MKTARFLAVAALLLVAPLARAERPPFEMTVWGTYVHPSGTTATDAFGTTVDFDEAWGLGFSLNLPMGGYAALELSAFSFETEGRIWSGNVQIATMGESSMTPYMAMLQVHPAGRGVVDPYLAAGVAYTVFGSYESQDLEWLGAGKVDLEDRFAPAIGAGVRFGVGKTFGVTVDARYVWQEADSKGISSSTALRLSVAPVLVSAGVSLRF